MGMLLQDKDTKEITPGDLELTTIRLNRLQEFSFYP